MAGDRESTPAGDTPAVLAAVSQHAARSFATVREAIDAMLEVMRDVLNMEVRMVNQIDTTPLTVVYAPGYWQLSITGASTRSAGSGQRGSTWR